MAPAFTYRQCVDSTMTSHHGLHLPKLIASARLQGPDRPSIDSMSSRATLSTRELTPVTGQSLSVRAIDRLPGIHGGLLKFYTRWPPRLPRSRGHYIPASGAHGTNRSVHTGISLGIASKYFSMVRIKRKHSRGYSLLDPCSFLMFLYYCYRSGKYLVISFCFVLPQSNRFAPEPGVKARAATLYLLYGDWYYIQYVS